MKHIRFLIFLAASGFLLVTSCMVLHRAERVNLAAYTPDYNSALRDDRVTRSVTIRSKDGILMYHKLFELARPMPTDIPQSVIDMTDYAAHHIFKCVKPTTNDELAMLKSYKIPMAGLDDCVVMYMAEKAAAPYLEGDQKNLLLWYSASQLYKRYGKKQIYADFLGSAYMQNDLWGLESASEFYFDRQLNDLEPPEKLWLMSVLTLGHTPDNFEQEFYGRMANLASFMQKKGAVGYDTAYLTVKYNKSRLVNNYPFYSSLVLRDMDRRGVDPQGEINVTSGLSMATTQAADDAIIERMLKLPEGIELAMAVVNVEDGTVEALAATSRTQYRTMVMKRQIGSTFKPIVYLTAFSNGITPNELIDDKKYDYKNHGQPYSPSNYDDYYMGVIPIRKGLVNSLNNATIRLAKITGLKKVANMANSMGMDYNVKPYLAMPLGIFPVSVLNVAKVYSVLGSYGVRQDISFIDNITDKEGRGVAWSKTPPERVAQAEHVYQTLYIMQDVVRRGTARGSGIIDGTSAKTGTTDDSKDAWTASVFYPYVVVVWAGYDDRRSMGDKGTGGSLAAPVIAAFQRNILPDVQKIDLNVPQGIVFKSVDSGTGKIVGDECPSIRSYEEAFSAGNVPDECTAKAVEPLEQKTSPQAANGAKADIQPDIKAGTDTKGQ